MGKQSGGSSISACGFARTGQVLPNDDEHVRGLRAVSGQLVLQMTIEVNAVARMKGHAAVRKSNVHRALQHVHELIARMVDGFDLAIEPG